MTTGGLLLITAAVLSACSASVPEPSASAGGVAASSAPSDEKNTETEPAHNLPVSDDLVGNDPASIGDYKLLSYDLVGQEWLPCNGDLSVTDSDVFYVSPAGLEVLREASGEPGACWRVASSDSREANEFLFVLRQERTSTGRAMNCGEAGKGSGDIQCDFGVQDGAYVSVRDLDAGDPAQEVFLQEFLRAYISASPLFLAAP